MKKIAIIGSTGSIGVNTLRVVEAHSGELCVVALAAKQNVRLLFEQAKKFRPHIVCLFESQNAGWLERKLKPLGIRVVTGIDGLVTVSTFLRAEQIVFAMVGAVGLKPLLAAVEAGKVVAIANKEPLVMAGELLRRKAGRSGGRLIPIDSEHSGLWQCLEGRSKATVKKLILTSSGGPFFNRKVDFRKVTSREALRHPRWKMGPKITIDSATLMNKGLEVIEAANLFDVSVDQVDVVIHPEAVVHALIEFVDGSQLAQLGITDMRLPIQYALSYPHRFQNSIPSLNLASVKSFHFYQPDLKRFPCLALGYEAKRRGGTMPAVLNAANEVAVQRFLGGSLPFSQIPKVIERVMASHRPVKNPSLAQILDADRWACGKAERYE
ncbi:MAG: 1-deoxy-D-xylulose-5-phosphate reductoisomerase [Candidatus Omnitrophica bacterium]|nr:1-deoxy-D-xylulose-5-phosphate reductoisomerase [Candidatus Omnitrophota bacterium]